MRGVVFIGTFILSITATIPGKPAYGQENSTDLDYQYALIEAVKQKNLGNLTEAIKLYRLVVREKEDCAVAYYELGTIFLMMNQPGPAVQELEKAYALDESNRWYTIAYLNALGSEESYGMMKEVLRMKIRSEGDEVEWVFQMANVYAADGNERKALRLLKRIERERGFSERVTLLKASIYEKERKYAEARREVEKVMDLFPEALQFRIVAAELSMKEGEEERAAEYYLEILEIDSSNIFAVTNLTDYYRKTGQIDKSLEYLAMSFYSEQIEAERKLAIMSYYLSEDEIISKNSASLDYLITAFRETHPDNKEGMVMAANFYIQIREFEKAFTELKAFIDTGETNYSAYMQAVMLANAAGRNEDLIEVSSRGIELYPDSADFRFFRAIGYYESEEYAQIIDNFKGIDLDLSQNREYATQSKIILAESLYRLERYHQSDSIFEQLIDEQPDNYVVLNNYSYYLAERGERLEAARRWSRIAVKNNPENATFLDTYAWVLYKLGEYEEAEKVILQALEKGGENDPEINEHAGDIQRALDSKEIARAYYENALILGGERERLEEKMESVR